MAWVTVTEDDIMTRLTGAELACIKTAALASGQADPLPVTIANVVNEIRGRLQRVTDLEAGATIPDSLLMLASNIIRMRLITRFPDAGFVTAERVLEYEQAVAAVENIGPLFGNGGSVLAGSPLIGQKATTLSRDAQEGA
jgi:hypothetical protein